MMMNQMMNILNFLFYNSMLMNEIKNLMNQELIMNNLMMNNMNNFMNMNNMNKMNNIMGMNTVIDDYTENDKINIKFEKDSKIKVILGNPEEKVSNVINKYKNVIKNEGQNTEHLVFIYNNQKLNPSRTIKEAGLEDFSVIIVVDNHNVIGG